VKQGRVKLDAKSYRELCRRVLNATVGAARIVVIHRIFKYITLHGEANWGAILRKTSSRRVRVVTGTHMTALPEEDFVKHHCCCCPTLSPSRHPPFRLVLG
jgi:hypothetical protein